MSGLETALKDMLMTPSGPAILTDVERLTFAAWMTMKAIIIDHKIVKEQGRQPFFTPRQRAEFMHSLAPPDRTSIWIAKLRVGDKAGEMIRAGYLNSKERARRHLLGFLTSLHLDSVAFQFLAVKNIAKAKRGSSSGDTPVVCASLMRLIDWTGKPCCRD